MSGAAAEVDGRVYATLNLNAFDDPRPELAATPVSYEGESAGRKPSAAAATGLRRRSPTADPRAFIEAASALVEATASPAARPCHPAR